MTGSLGNQAPVVNAGPDQAITLPAAASLLGSVTDDGLPPAGNTLRVSWSEISGPGTVSFTNLHLASTPASFSASGTYVLRMTVSDSVLSSSDDIVLTAHPEPSMPRITATVTPTPDSAGWNNSSVTVSFDCFDAYSEVSNCPAPVTLTDEVSAQTESRMATDRTCVPVFRN